MVMMINRVASKNTVIFNYLSNQIIRVPPTSPEKLLLKTLFSYITIYECIEYIDRGPKQGVNNGENDAGKKASKCLSRHQRAFWRRQSEQVPGIQLYWNLILYILGSYLIGPVLVMRREMTNATTVVRRRVLGKLPR